MESVSIRLAASSWRSEGRSSGKPYKIRSRFSSPAMVTSKRGMFRLLDGFVFAQNNHAAQVAGIVGIKSLFQASVKPHELTRENVASEARLLRQVEAKLDQQVDPCPHPAIRLVVYRH